MLSGQTSATLAVNLTHAGADDFVVKDQLSADVLRRAIDNGMARQYQRETAAQNKKLLAELQSVNQQLEEKNRRLAELYTTAHQFVDNVSHEFRTPLTVIKEYASLIRDGVLGEVNGEQNAFLEKADRFQISQRNLAFKQEGVKLSREILSVLAGVQTSVSFGCRSHPARLCDP